MITTSRGLLKYAVAGMFVMSGLLAINTTAQAQQAPVVPASSGPVVASGEAKPVIAWVDFCRRYASECRVDTNEPEQIELTQKSWKTIVSTNLRTNREIEPVTDMDHWGQVDRWDMAEDGKGDCEEYVLVKRKKLVEAGFPRRALLVTVVIDDENQGHAVLMVRTDRGDFILDNKRNAVLPWQQTGYIYVKRESQQKVAWTSLGGQGSPTVTAAR
jgi:predicted transglutaminase-like cysteine proteinase